MAPQQTGTLESSVVVNASPEAVWKVVSDPRRTGEWSPECRKVVPFGAVRPGVTLLGLNRRKVMVWPTLSKVTAFEPAREISWRVSTNRTRWSFRLEPVEGGTRLTNVREVPDGLTLVAKGFAVAFLGGMAGHDVELQAGIGVSLQKIKAIVERAVGA